jgi:homopolymeric O-antigen transport system ATP-binding protein
MNDIAIRVENLSKLYRIGAKQESYQTLRDTLAGAAAAPFRRIRSTFQRSDVQTFERSNAFWALKDVSLEVKRGEVVGIIGRNGAGKSTLLKILSRITEPTGGYADIYGRVGSLLEVGTGFHPELTGRENIYLNGAILGMKREEIHRRFDEIVEFAEVEQFVDTPVKHYSSGMYLRLAFAVAAHMEPEILLVDEVLAVGDAQFQKKCLGKLGEVAREGRTVLFVSHNMAALGRLCPMAVLLDNGVLALAGNASQVISTYLASSEAFSGHREWSDLDIAPGDEFLRAVSAQILDLEGELVSDLHQDQPFVISITYRVLKPMMNANVGFELTNMEGDVIFMSFDADNPTLSGNGRKEGLYVAKCKIPANFLNEGIYLLNLHAGIPFHKQCILDQNTLRIEIGTAISGDGPVGRMGARRAGILAPELDWSLDYLG